ncbi:MAG: amino acid ABC transporter substrate-binding protein [Oscillospiraceae bacterium]
MKFKFLSAMCAVVLASAMFMTGCGSESSSKDAASGEDNSLQNVLDNGKLVLGLDATFKPMGFTDENDNVVGFDIDVAEEVCKRLGVKLETYGVNWETKEIDLDAGTIDCIWNGLSVSEERKEKMLMSDPYMRNEMIFVVAKDSDIKSLDDLSGKTIAVQNGSTAQEILNDSDVGKSAGAINELATNVEALNQLNMNMCDAVFLDSVVADYEINAGAEVKKLDEGLEPEEYAIGFKKGNQKLCDKVEEILKEMKADGTLGEISTKWFGSDKTIIGE